MDPKTARKYRDAGKLPSQMKKPRNWRTREDPFAKHWEEVEEMLELSPGLEAKTLFEYLQREYPGVYHDGQLRTLQRRIKRWRAQKGPDKDVVFEQEHRPGEAMQTDFTHATSLTVTIAGEVFVHLLCLCVLPFSNWWWPTICRSESLEALKRSVQSALWTLGGVTKEHQTDNSTAATHRLESRGREFNAAYLELMKHLDMTPRTIAVGRSNQNGDVESRNGHFKRKIDQELMLRGSRDFETEQDYLAFLHALARRGHAHLGPRFEKERALLKPLPARRMAEFTQLRVKVRRSSTILVKNNRYSVPSRLIGEYVRVRVYDSHLDVFYADALELRIPRLIGRGHRINYRHLIDSLERKPGAFARYKFRDALFLTTNYRRAYDALCEQLSERRAALEYVRILKLAAAGLESDIDVALSLLLEDGELPTHEDVADLVDARRQPTPPPPLEIEPPDLGSYDDLLASELMAEVA